MLRNVFQLAYKYSCNVYLSFVSISCFRVSEIKTTLFKILNKFENMTTKFKAFALKVNFKVLGIKNESYSSMVYKHNLQFK